jgi:hypothetical protein
MNSSRGPFHHLVKGDNAKKLVAARLFKDIRIRLSAATATEAF